MLTTKNEDLNTLRHSTAHILASAVAILFPNTKFAIGPTIEDGFYYDFDSEHTFTPEDLISLETKMQEIITGDYSFIREEIIKEEANKIFKDNPYKLEIISEIKENTVTIYKHHNFTDLCRGPHIARTSEIKHFKLLSIAGAYWRGDEKNKMLQRVYGTAFNSKKDLDSYINKLEEAKKRDHRVLGKTLDLFSISDEIGAGLINWHPRGAIIRHVIENFWKQEHMKKGYELVYTPHIAKFGLWKTSGHAEFYKENMYSGMDIDGINYIVKPMNCPFHVEIYKSKKRSYRELPIRWAELGTVYRYEKSGVLHGLLRVRGFTQDDAHIFTSLENLDFEILEVLKFTIEMLKTFGFNEYEINLSTRPENYIGDEKIWDSAQNALIKALENQNLPYEIDPGAGVFYGPKIDIKIKDCLNRAWQCSTIQVDFNLPIRFDINYVGQDNKEHKAIMIHRALLGSLERFIGCLIEHYMGDFPFWLSPTQISVLTINDKVLDYGKEIVEKLKCDFRVISNFSNETLNYKIREAELLKIPYIIIIGEKEAKEKTLAIRTRRLKEKLTLSLIDLIKRLKEEESVHI
jgi:threonyl-tRNA synthetase